MRMTELELQRLVMRRCRELGLAAFHVGDSRRSMAPGWPDLVILSLRGLIFRELKSERGSMSIQQREIAWTLICAGADFAVWRPKHWTDGTIGRELACLAGTGNAEIANKTLGKV